MKNNRQKKTEKRYDKKYDSSLPQGAEDGALYIYGRNAVAEAIKSGRNIEAIFVQNSSANTLKSLIEMARNRSIKVNLVEKWDMEKLAGENSHQGIVCKASPYEYAELDDLFIRAQEPGRLPVIIILDEVEDPHNLGAIMRTAECVGASGIIIPKRRSAGITETVVKTSAGAVEYMPCARVSNISAAIDKLKDNGYWIYGCDMDGENLWETKLTGKIAIVIGNEGSGISRLVREKCDFIVSIPMRGQIESLNASNAAAVVLYEVARQAAQ